MRSSEVLLDLARCFGQPQDPMSPLPGAWPALTRPARERPERVRRRRAGTSAPEHRPRTGADRPRPAAPRRPSGSPCSTAITAEHRVAHGKDRRDLEVGIDPIPEAAGAVRLVDQQRFVRGRSPRPRCRPCARWRSADTAWARNKMCGTAQPSPGVESLVDRRRRRATRRPASSSDHASREYSEPTKPRMPTSSARSTASSSSSTASP